MFVMTQVNKETLLFTTKIVNVLKKTISMEEGCLTFGYYVQQDPEAVQVTFAKNRKGEEQSMELTGMDPKDVNTKQTLPHGVFNLIYISDFKLQRALQKRDKLIKKYSNEKNPVGRYELSFWVFD